MCARRFGMDQMFAGELLDEFTQAMAALDKEQKLAEMEEAAKAEDKRDKRPGK